MDLALAKENMVKQQIRTLGVSHNNFLSAVLEIPREEFFPAAYRELSYSEVEIPLKSGRKTLTPQVITQVLQELAPQRKERSLLVGCGCGYLTALLSKLGKLVEVVDDNQDIISDAQEALKNIGIYNVKYHLVPLLKTVNQTIPSGLNTEFEVVLIREFCLSAPTEYFKCLSDKGRLLYFFQKEGYARAILVRKTKEGFSQKPVFDVYEAGEAGVPSTTETFSF